MAIYIMARRLASINHALQKDVERFKSLAIEARKELSKFKK